MDNVNAFILEGDDPILRDLAACFENLLPVSSEHA